MLRNLLVLMLLVPAALAGGFALPPERGELRVLVLGDFNGPYGSVGYGRPLLDLLAGISHFDADLVLLPGDLIAGQDRSLPDQQFSRMWDAFEREVAAALRSAGVPFAAALGNHDGSSLRSAGQYTFAREREAAAEYWHAVRDRLGVQAADSSDYPFNWSFTFGDLFVIVWDASSAMIDSAQTEWLFSQLQSAEAQEAELRWLVGHLPLVGIAERRDRPGEVLPDGAELAQAGAGWPGHFVVVIRPPGTGRARGLQLLMSGGIVAGPHHRRRAGPPTVTVADLWPAAGGSTTRPGTSTAARWYRPLSCRMQSRVRWNGTPFSTGPLRSVRQLTWPHAEPNP